MLNQIKPSILFESIPPFSDNTMPVFEEMIRRGMDKKYRMIWFLKWNLCATIKKGNIHYWNPRDRRTLRERIRNYSMYYKTKCLISCNAFLTSRGSQDSTVTSGEHQIAFYLTHGTPMKSLKAYYSCPEGIDYVLSASPRLKRLMADEFLVQPEKVFSAGFPRNDVFSQPRIDLKGKLGGGFDKIIIWYPTYRQHMHGPVKLSLNPMPIIQDENKAELLNHAAKENNSLIIYKPHFAQDISLLHELNLSNIRIIDDSFFPEMGFSSYEMLAASDALITDYSSLYFDYTLADKPIGVVWEDIDEYRVFPGFAVDLDYYLKGAEKIYTIEELCAFIYDVAHGKDSLRQERREIRDVVNISTDGMNSSRVVDFIVEKAGL